MESLLANYASSDDDDEQQQHNPPSSITTNNTHSHKTTPSSSLSLFSSLPPPKSQTFSSPLPQTHSSSTFPNPSDPTPKRVVVQFKPPPTKPSDSDPDSDDEPPKNPKRPTVSSAGDSSSVRSFLSSIPAPKNSFSSSSSTTLGGVISGSSRRSTIEGYEAPPSDVGQVDDSSQQPHYVDCSSGYGDGIGFDYSGLIASGCWSASSNAPVPVPGKRGRKDVATEIVEVKQDDLTKDRPREDQVKLTGIAFGPSYQPASAKGKPSKLHKRKHQIGSLYYDMKQKEMELAERRARGFLTKAQTQGKYGW